MIHKFTHALAAGLLLATGLSQAIAQVNPPLLPLRATAPGSASTPAKDEGPRFDFKFEGVPLAEVIQQARQHYEKKTGNFLNIIVPEHLRAMTEQEMVTLDVQQVTAAELFNILGMASERREQRITGYNNPHIPSAVTINTQIFPFRYEFLPVATEGKNPMFVFKAEPIPDDVPDPRMLAQNEAPRRPYVQYMQLEPYLDRFAVEDIITAIRTGWQLAGMVNPEPKVKFHEETKLLIVAGDPQQVEVVTQVLNSLNVPPASAEGFRAPPSVMRRYFPQPAKEGQSPAPPSTEGLPKADPGKSPVKP